MALACDAVERVLGLLPEVRARVKSIVGKLGAPRELVPCLEAYVLNGLVLRLASRARRGGRVDLGELSSRVEKALRDRARLERLVKVCEFYLHLLSESAHVVIDVGCGAGLNVLIARRYGCVGALLVGIDRDPYFLGIFKRLCEDAEAVLADAGRLPLRSGSADVLFSTTLIHELPGLGAIGEFYRVLGEGGSALIGDVVARYVPSALLNAVRAVRVRLGMEPETPYTLRQIVSEITSLGTQVDGCLTFWNGPIGVAVLTFRKSRTTKHSRGASLEGEGRALLRPSPGGGR